MVVPTGNTTCFFGANQHDFRTASCFIVVHVDALQLQVGVAVVRAGGVDAVFIGHNFPELGCIIQKTETMTNGTDLGADCDRNILWFDDGKLFFLIFNFCKYVPPIWLPHWPAWMWTSQKYKLKCGPRFAMSGKYKWKDLFGQNDAFNRDIMCPRIKNQLQTKNLFPTKNIKISFSRINAVVRVHAF